jgi:hypothetical protein
LCESNISLFLFRVPHILFNYSLVAPISFGEEQIHYQIDSVAAPPVVLSSG